jgi:hypothetical protein
MSCDTEDNLWFEDLKKKGTSLGSSICTISSGSSGGSAVQSPMRDYANLNFTEECQHRMIEENGSYFCDFCGKEEIGNISYDKDKTWDHSKNGNARLIESNDKKDKDKKVCYDSIKEDLKFMNLDEDVLIEIFETYLKVTNGGTSVHRSKLRRSYLSACVMHVNNMRRIPCDENDLMKRFKIDQKDYSKGFKQLKMKVRESRCCQNEVINNLLILYDKFKVEVAHRKTIEDIYCKVQSLRDPCVVEDLLVKSNLTEEEFLQTKKKESYDEGPVFKDTSSKVIAAVVMYYWYSTIQNKKIESDLVRNKTITFEEFSSTCDILKYTLHNAYKDCYYKISTTLDYFKKIP